MPFVDRNGIHLYFETHGAKADPALLLVSGLGDQLLRWSPDIIGPLVDAGLFVVTMDNRDSGRSTKLKGVEAPHPIAVVQSVFEGNPVEIPYTLDDMADDAMAVVDAAGIKSTHVLGMSMGGMIAQTITIRHPTRVRSLVSLMSTTGRMDIALPRLDLVEGLLREGAATIEDEIKEGAAFRKLVQGSVHAMPDDEIHARMDALIRRDNSPDGVARQFAALLAAGDARRTHLANITVPVLVIHGEDDPLVLPEGGRDTHDAIPGSRLVMVPGLGHDLPSSFVPTLIELVLGHIRAPN